PVGFGVQPQPSHPPPESPRKRSVSSAVKPSGHGSVSPTTTPSSMFIGARTQTAPSAQPGSAQSGRPSQSARTPTKQPSTGAQPPVQRVLVPVPMVLDASVGVPPPAPPDRPAPWKSRSWTLHAERLTSAAIVSPRKPIMSAG